MSNIGSPVRDIRSKFARRRNVHHNEHADTICKKWKQQYYEKSIFETSCCDALRKNEDFSPMHSKMTSETNQTELKCEVNSNNCGND